jgi:GNAT superfamily N-acetyltransferase
MPSIAEIEAATLSTWPALQTAHDRLWLWRGAGGYSKRANSIHCLDPSDDVDADARLEKMTALSRFNDIPPVFRVTPLCGPGVIAAIDRAGWVEFERSLVLARQMPDDDWKVSAKTRLFDPRDPAWHETQAAMSGYNRHTIDILKSILDVAACDNCGVLAYDEDDQPVAAALATVSNGIGVYLNVVVRESARGKGYGRAVIAAALNWSREAGATTAAIQVLASNTPAVTLYRSFGLEQVYDYHYRKPAE